MAGEEGKLVLGATSTNRSPTTEPMELAPLQRKAEEEILDTADGEEATEPQHHAEGGIKEAVGYEEEEAELGVRYHLKVYQHDYEHDDYEYEYDEEEQRRKVRAMLESFPEAITLGPHELDAAVERILEQSKPEHDNEAAQGKIRLLREDVELAVDECDDSFRKYEDSEEERKLQLERGRFLAKVRKGLIDKGFVEVEEDYYEKKDEYERQCMQMIRQQEEEWERCGGYE